MRVTLPTENTKKSSKGSKAVSKIKQPVKLAQTGSSTLTLQLEKLKRENAVLRESLRESTENGAHIANKG